MVYTEMLLETKITTSSAVTTTYLIILLNTSAAVAATITTLAISNIANTCSNTSSVFTIISTGQL